MDVIWNLSCRGGSGRPRHIQGRDLRHLRLLALRKWLAGVRQIREELVRATRRQFSCKSVNQRLLVMGLRDLRPPYVFSLTPQYTAHRLEWHRLRQNWIGRYFDQVLDPGAGLYVQDVQNGIFRQDSIIMIITSHDSRNKGLPERIWYTNHGMVSKIRGHVWDMIRLKSWATAPSFSKPQWTIRRTWDNIDEQEMVI